MLLILVFSTLLQIGFCLKSYDSLRNNVKEYGPRITNDTSDNNYHCEGDDCKVFKCFSQVGIQTVSKVVCQNPYCEVGYAASGRVIHRNCSEYNVTKCFEISYNRQNPIRKKCVCYGELCNGMSCFDLERGSNIQCNTDKCMTVFDYSLAFIIYQGCYSQKHVNDLFSYRECIAPICDPIEAQYYEYSPLPNISCWKGDEKIKCGKGLCYVRHVDKDITSPIIDSGCAESLEPEKALNHSGIKNEYEFCAVDLCNNVNPFYCYDGFEGECDDSIEEFKVLKSKYKLNEIKQVQCDRHHQSNICVKREYTNGTKQCTRYACHYYNFMENIILNNDIHEEEQNLCQYMEIYTVPTNVCRCRRQNCFKPRISCHKTNTKGESYLVQCASNVVSCKTTKNIITNQIISRNCAFVDDIVDGCLDSKDGLQTCYCAENNCNGLKCYDSLNKETIPCDDDAVNCYAEFDNSYMFVVARGCTKNSTEYEYSGNFYLCNTDNCNSPKNYGYRDLRSDDFECYKYNGTGEVTKIRCENKLCLTVHEDYDLLSPIIELNCAPKTETQSGNIGSKNKFEVCAEPLCNDMKNHSCFHGRFGDCNWLNPSPYPFSNWEIIEKQSDRQHIKDICLVLKTVFNGRECFYFPNIHYNAKLAIELVIKNPKKEEKCFNNMESSEKGFSLCQCTGNLCNDLNIEEVFCYVSPNSSLGALTKCPKFATHCRTLRDVLTNEVVERLCSPTGNVFPECVIGPGSAKDYGPGSGKNHRICDCLGNGCNLETNKGCWVGFHGDCEGKAKELKYEYCQDISDNYCHMTESNSGLCYEYSCQFNGPSHNNITWPSDNNQCIKVDGILHCRNAPNKNTRAQCYKSNKDETIDAVTCIPFITHCRTITDRDNKISRDCSPFFVSVGCTTSGESTICDCVGDNCNAAINCYSSKEKKIVKCRPGTATCSAILDESYLFAIERNCGNDKNFVGFVGNKFYCNTEECNDEKKLFPDLRPDDFKCYNNSEMDIKNCSSKMCKIFANQYDCENQIMISGDFGEYETCAEPLCNHPQPWKCYQGFIGDCLWLTRNDTGFDFTIEVPYVAECDYWHVKDICAQQTWTNKVDSDRVCKYFTCHHTHAEFGVKLIRESKEKKDDCVEAQINGHHVRICQCTNEKCNRPVTPSMSCYISSNSELGVLTKCLEYTTHCQEKRIKETGAVLERKCSPVGRVHPHCHERDGYQYCDCAGNGCNNREQFKKKCYVGTYGNCQSGELDPWLASLNHQPVPKDCASWFDNDCHTTRIPNKGQLCTVFSCDYQQIGIHSRAVFGKFRCVNTQWKEKPLKLVSHCRCLGENCQRAQQIIENLRREQQIAAVHKAFNTSG